MVRTMSGLPAVAVVGEMVIAGRFTANFSALDVATGASFVESHTSTVNVAVMGAANNFAGNTAVSWVVFRKVAVIGVETPAAVHMIWFTRCAPGSKFDPVTDSFKSGLPAVALLGDTDESVRSVLCVSVTLPPEELPPPHPKAPINIVKATAEMATLRNIATSLGLKPITTGEPYSGYTGSNLGAAIHAT